MIKRTTIELDEDLLERAKRALGEPTTRVTVEEALRRMTQALEDERAERARRQMEFLINFSDNIDVDVLNSDEMWR
jgi:Arc/MetJ family transcription regulator